MRKKIIFAFMLCVGVMGYAFITPSSWSLKTSSEKQEPPLLDRELFFGNPSLCGAKLSPDGAFISFLKPLHGVLNIWIKSTDAPFDTARPLTSAVARPIRSYRWSRDGRCIVYIQDEKGNENFHLYAVDPYGREASRDLTPIDGVRAQVLCMPKDSPDVIYVGLNARDERYHDVVRITLSTGERTVVRENMEEIADWIFDHQGNLRAGTHVASDGTSHLLCFDDEDARIVWSCSPQESLCPFAFHPDGQRLYMATNKGPQADISRLVLFNLQTGAEEAVESDPEEEVDFEMALFSPVTDELVATSYVGDCLRIYPKNEQWGEDYQLIKTALPEGEVAVTSTSASDNLWIVTRSSDKDPETTYLFNRATKTLTELYRAWPFLPSEHLAAMKPIQYMARDGLAIHGYLTIPRGKEPKNLPLVVFPHGGPWARDTWGFNGYVQLLANRGYAVLQMNFRGSTGYGKEFLNAGNGQWGDAMQDDITDGVRFLVAQSIADPKKVAIFGGSYGGYATLAGLAFSPDVYAAGISYVGPSNLLTLLKSFPPYWATGMGEIKQRVGDLDDPADVERLRRQSPLFSAERIIAPLLVVQGAHDPRVKKAESDQIVAALRSLGRQVEYLVATDEGHGFICPDNKMAFAAALEKFLAQHLGGRYQSDIPGPVAERLHAMTMDYGEKGS
jgi:dipeptidyl aminopeptidase/acylaminoacyl peptidase